MVLCPRHKSFLLSFLMVKSLSNLIFGSKWDPSFDPPRQLILVQWTNLPPKDATWEDWSSLRDGYHLKNKVFSQGMGKIGSQAQLITTQVLQLPTRHQRKMDLSTLMRGPKGSPSTPLGWNDYVH